MKQQTSELIDECEDEPRPITAVIWFAVKLAFMCFWLPVAAIWLTVRALRN